MSVDAPNHRSIEGKPCGILESLALAGACSSHVDCRSAKLHILNT